MSEALNSGRGEVAVRNLSKSFNLNRQRLSVLEDVALEISGGECVAIVGQSGSGKTTLLRVIAGLETPDQGEVLIDGVPISGVGTDRAVVFQEPRLLPWLTVLGNVAFALEARGVPRREAEQKSRSYIKLVGLQDFETAFPRQLSGGMAQRVGIARALTVQPEILLLDEPFGALDAMTKIIMQEELARIWRDENVTMVMVTHDLEEAIYLADRVVVLPNNQTGEIRVIEIDLPRPRDRSEDRFVRHREQLLRQFGLH